MESIVVEGVEMDETGREGTTNHTLSAQDGRLKLSLRMSGPKFLSTKADLERMEGRPLTQDEAMMMILAYVELDSPDQVMTHVNSTLRELKRFLDEHREDLSANCVELFREALLDVMRGKVPPRHLSEVLIDVK